MISESNILHIYQVILVFLSGKLMEYNEPEKLMRAESSLFGEFVKEYWSRTAKHDI